MASASPAIGGFRRRCWLGALAGAVGPGVVAKSLLGIDIATSKREVPVLLAQVCGHVFAFSIELTQKAQKRGQPLGSRILVCSCFEGEGVRSKQNSPFSCR